MSKAANVETIASAGKTSPKTTSHAALAREKHKKNTILRNDVGERFAEDSNVCCRVEVFASFQSLVWESVSKPFARMADISLELAGVSCR
mmetsp:Transcript_20191/g.35974  ORF Transcript_20191/g.35974 Transcript_20191/m.35974 type:complete len:90 (-) Transcript_20191:150-419(-)